jgi:DNA-binding NarL/FixJ family response regulator
LANRHGVQIHVEGDAELVTAVASRLTGAGYRLDAPAASARPAAVVVCVAGASREWLAVPDQQRAAHDAPVVVVLEALPSPHLMRALMRHAEGLVLVEALDRALVPTVEAVLAGQSAHPLAFREQLDRPLLTAREKQVLAMVVLGMPNGDIARKLFLTEASIKAHLTSAFAKLGVRSRDAAAALILDPDAGYGPGILRITPEEPFESQR